MAAVMQLCGAHLGILGVSLRGSEGTVSTQQTRMEFLLWQLCGAHLGILGISLRWSEGRSSQRTREAPRDFLKC